MKNFRISPRVSECQAELEKILAKYPDLGFIYGLIGVAGNDLVHAKTNGFGTPPILSALLQAIIIDAEKHGVATSNPEAIFETTSDAPIAH
jgi:hypothetical protein